jgi:hypothetical protein
MQGLGECEEEGRVGSQSLSCVLVIAGWYVNVNPSEHQYKKMYTAGITADPVWH